MPPRAGVQPNSARRRKAVPKSFTSRGLKVGLYYHWRHPGFGDPNKHKVLAPECDPAKFDLKAQKEFQLKQIGELLEKYPECFYFWNDAYDPGLGTAEELLKFERGINPNVLASSNWWNWGRKGTPYLDIPVTELRMFPEDHKGPGETCYSLTGHNWFWNAGVRGYPAATGVVERLRAINSRNANYLLNVPPNKQGKIDEAQKGTYGTPPPRTPFPFPWEADFDDQQAGDTPRYFSDQKGTFEISKRPDGGLCLAQVVPQEGILWPYAGGLPKPYTLIGDPEWRDCAIESDVLLSGGDAEIGSRYAGRGRLGYRWILASDGQWKLNWHNTTLAAGQVPDFDPAAWTRMRLELDGDQIRGFIHGRRLADVQHAAGTKGMAFLASTYHRNCFDRIRIMPLHARSGPAR